MLVVRIVFRAPIEHTLAPDVDVAHAENQEEREDLNKPRPRQLTQRQHPRSEKRDLDIEEQEDHADHVELHALPLARVANWWHAAFIRRQFFWSGIMRAEETGNDDGDDAGSDSDNPY